MSIALVTTKLDAADWTVRLSAALPGETIEAWPMIEDLDAVDVALVASPPPGALGHFTRLAFIQSLWMGVDGLIADPDLPADVPLARLVDPGMVAAMSETVLARVLDWHRHLYRYRAQQSARSWQWQPQFLASDRTVSILGMGALGRDAAAKLAALGFRVCGWSRRPREIDGVECFSGADGLDAAIARAQALVCLLPLTPATRGLLDARRLALLPEGACVINVARGPHVVESALLAALESGRLAHAYLDVFDTEPLPQDHAYWVHPGVTVTPHVAALTEPRTALAKVVANIERFRRGEPLEALVDRTAGY